MNTNNKRINVTSEEEEEEDDNDDEEEEEEALDDEDNDRMIFLGVLSVGSSMFFCFFLLL
jgi:hypothetical protein